jgi:uncharacterized protein YciW
VTETPWLVVPEDRYRLRSVGISDEGIVQAACVAAFFNYVTRIADGTGLEWDYESPLPRVQIDRSRAAVERPPRDRWPSMGSRPLASLSLRPQTQQSLAQWDAYMFERDAPLTRRQRAIISRAAAWETCDQSGADRWPDADPRNDAERALVSYARRLSNAPWSVGEADLLPLRELGLDDRGLLDVISLVAYQNTLSRLALALR